MLFFIKSEKNSLCAHTYIIYYKILGSQMDFLCVCEDFAHETDAKRASLPYFKIQLTTYDVNLQSVSYFEAARRWENRSILAYVRIFTSRQMPKEPRYADSQKKVSEKSNTFLKAIPKITCSSYRNALRSGS